MELYVLIPFRDLDNKPPNIDPLQDWAFGIVLLNILHGTINILPENHLQHLLTRVSDKIKLQEHSYTVV